jgi:hypothetical protein
MLIDRNVLFAQRKFKQVVPQGRRRNDTGDLAFLTHLP